MLLRQCGRKGRVVDAVLGIAVTGPIARLALVAATPAGPDVIDQSTVDVAAHPIEKLTDTVVGTHRLLADEHHRLVATGVCWSDQRLADELRRLLINAGLEDVALVSEPEAATALVRNTSRGSGEQGTAVLLVGDQTATLSMVGADEAPPTVLAAQPIEGSDATAALETLMNRLGAQTGAAGDVFVIGTSPELNTVANQLRATSSMPVQVPDAFAIARGAAMAVEPTSMTQAVMLPDDTTAIPPAAEMTQMSAQHGEQLAYSMADESELLPMDAESGPEGDYAEGPGGRLSTRSLLISNAVVAFAVIGFAVLAVAVAVTIRPSASTQPVQGHPNTAPGKFMPPLPTQQQAPLPPVPAVNPAAVLPPGSGLPEVSSPGPQQEIAPVPEGPPAPAGPPAPNVPPPVNPPNPVPIPIPIPIPIPFPNTTGATTGTTTGTTGTTTGTTGATTGTTGATTGATTGTTTGGTTGTTTGGTTGTTTGGTTGATTGTTGATTGTTGATTGGTTGATTGGTTGATTGGTTGTTTGATTGGGGTTGTTTGGTTGGGTTGGHTTGTTGGGTTGTTTGGGTTGGHTTGGGTTGGHHLHF
jgi:hypothetical protein